MSEKFFRGKITFINNDKHKATIEYVIQNKIKSIQAIIDDKQQEKYVQLKLIKKPHRFLEPCGCVYLLSITADHAPLTAGTVRSSSTANQHPRRSLHCRRSSRHSSVAR
jgi:hypothetical protein